MPWQREPTSLILAKGKSHLGKNVISERLSSEVRLPEGDVLPPRRLSTVQRKSFREIAAQLQAIDIIAPLDAEILAEYIEARDRYVSLNAKYKKMLREKLDDFIEGIDNSTKLSGQVDRAFKQCLACAQQLGLTITSRCKLVVPQVEQEPENKFERFASG